MITPTFIIAIATVLALVLGFVILRRKLARGDRATGELAELDDDFDPPIASPGVWARDMKPRD